MVPFRTFIVKIASRCNLNCGYCFVYNKADNRWLDQPKFMDFKTFAKSVNEIKDHALTHDLKKVSIIFHGGEPLLVGFDRLSYYFKVIRDAFHKTGIRVNIGMQSNGILFNEKIGSLIRENKATIGISIDGPPRLNDISRKYHNGSGSGDDLEKVLLTLKDDFNDIFSGFLVVVNIENDPIEILDYLRNFQPKSIDFLLPYDNWDNRPIGKENEDSVIYGKWLQKLFRYWFDEINGVPPIRFFDNIMKLGLGGLSSVESLGLDPVDLLVIETNGDLEGVDSLKATYNGATILGMNISHNSLDEACEHQAVKFRQVGKDGLCTKCNNCEIQHICGGGYIPNRYSRENGFMNPSIYCADLQLIIKDIIQTLKSEKIFAH